MDSITASSLTISSITQAAIPEPGYDVFLIAGQSNTYNGICSTGDTCPNPTLDSTDTDILMLGRDGNDGDAILASEPLSHIGYLGSRPDSDVVGWGLAFAKMYKAQGYLQPNRKIILVPNGEGGSGFADNKWNDGDVNYNDAVSRVNTAMSLNIGGTNRLKGILWHQGEDEASNSTNATAHANALLNMIDAMRTDFSDSTIPFIAGGLVPALVEAPVLEYDVVNANIEAIVTARNYTGYADPANPTELTTEGTASGGNNHFSSYSMRGSNQDFNDYTTLGLAGRYWVAYLAALNNN